MYFIEIYYTALQGNIILQRQGAAYHEVEDTKMQNLGITGIS